MKSILAFILAVAVICFVGTLLSIASHTTWDDDFMPLDDMSIPIPTSVKRRARRSVRFAAKITFASDGEAWLYINGVQKDHIDDPVIFKQVVYGAKRGDVVSLKVRSNGNLRGVAVNIEYQGRSYPSNGKPTSSWKAQKATGPYTDWMSTEYSSCAWLCPMPAKAGVIRAAMFPSASGATYVWASSRGYGHEDMIWMRHVIEEENCDHQRPQQQPKKRLELCDLRQPVCGRMWGLIPKTKASHTPGIITGAGSSGNDEHCRCQRMVGPISICYKMYFKGRSLGRCIPYVCGPKYECVKDGGDDLPKCVRRVTTSRIIRHPKYRRYCQKVTIPPITFYVLSGE